MHPQNIPSERPKVESEEVDLPIEFQLFAG